MSGRQEKAARRAEGISISARRDESAFDRKAREVIKREEVRFILADALSEARAKRRSENKRRVLAAISLTVFTVGMVILFLATVLN